MDEFTNILYGGYYDFTLKDICAQNYIRYMLCRTQSMFKYDNLPETIPEFQIERILQTSGHICIFKPDKNIYGARSSLYGKDAYYMPVKAIVSNPYWEKSFDLNIGKDCIIIKSDSYYAGLLPMLSRYASKLVENDITMFLANVGIRSTVMITTPDDKTKKAVDLYLQDLLNGKLGVNVDNQFFEGIKVQPLASTAGNNTLTQLIEMEQYIKASCFNELGLSANYNMKRESIMAAESEADKDTYLPLVDDMLKCRKDGINQVNEMFGLEITVELNSAWKKRQGGEKYVDTDVNNPDKLVN